MLHNGNPHNTFEKNRTGRLNVFLSGAQSRTMSYDEPLQRYKLSFKKLEEYSSIPPPGDESVVISYGIVCESWQSAYPSLVTLQRYK